MKINGTGKKAAQKARKEAKMEAKMEAKKEAEKKFEKKAYANKVKSAKYFISIGLSNSQISKGTGLTKDEVEDLRNK